MKKTFEQLSTEAQGYIKSRFGEYGISGEDGYNSLVAEEAKELSSEELIDFLRIKDISHIIPQTTAPHLAENIDYIYLEDSIINRARGAKVSSDEEISIAWEDQIKDVYSLQGDAPSWEQFSDSLDRIDNSLVDEIVGTSFILGMCKTGYETRQALTKGEIQLNEAPKYFTVKTGSRTIKLAVIGFCLTSSSPIIVYAGVGYLVHKNKNLIKKLFNGAYNIAIHEKTRRYAEITIDGTASAITTIGHHAFKAITSDTGKAVALTTVNTTGIILKESAKIIYPTGKFIGKKSIDIISDERTTNFALKAIIILGKLVIGIVKVTFSLIVWILKKLMKS